MTIGGILDQGRRTAEALMLDTCLIERAGEGDPVFDPETSEYTHPPAVTVYEGKCRVQTRDSLDVTTDDFGGRAVNTSRVTLQLPMAAAGIRNEDLVTITAAAFDADLVGRVLRIVDYLPKSQATARRIECEWVSS